MNNHPVFHCLIPFTLAIVLHGVSACAANLITRNTSGERVARF
ncbi:MAG: hypothetical protein O2960_00665 [Verrucomicrobia bacterium]|nr:hypothetical protein [Verrucomicrobiota bacterium]